jgi:hypothetical protein
MTHWKMDGNVILVSKSTAKENTTLRACQLLERPNCKPKTFFLQTIEQGISLENYLQFMKQKFKQMNNIIVS